MNRRLCVWAVFAAIFAAEASASEYSKILEGVYPAREPGAAAMVARGDKVLFEGASGMADLEHGVPLKPDMVFELGSITKQFTAAVQPGRPGPQLDRR